MIMDYIDQNYYSPDVYAHNVTEHPEQFGTQPCYGNCQITENLKHELAIYKEALELGCESLANSYCTEQCQHKCYECTLWGVRNKECFNRMINNHIEEFLQKVRETQ